MKKKIIMIFALAMLVSFNSIPVFALDGPGNNSQTEDDNCSCCIAEEIPIDEEQSAYYSMLGSISPRTSEDITITGIPNYYQTGDYSHLTGCQSSSTVNNLGCALVSFAMVGHKYNSAVTVESVNAIGAMGSNCNFAWETAASHFGLKISSVGASSQKESEQKTKIRGLLRDGYAAIVGLHQVGTANTHYVVVYRYVSNSSGEIFYLKNPSTYGATTLEGYMDNWYIEYVYKLYK